MIIDILLAISLFANVYLLHKYGALIIRNRETEKRLSAVSVLLTKEVIEKNLKWQYKLEDLNVNREN